MKRPLIILATFFTSLGSIALFWFLARGYWYEEFIDPEKQIYLPDAGVFGDFIGGFIGTIFAFVGLLLLYETLNLQRKEFTASKDVFIKQQFDNTFFELINLYRKIIEDISVNGFSGKSFFDNEKAIIQANFTPQRVFSYNRKTAVRIYQNFYVQNKNITTVYYKTLYRIYSLIDHSKLKEEDKITYSKILRGQLSDSELFFIRYNAMTENGKKSIYYINKYDILKHLSHFELLEFKDWWSKLNGFERNGLDLLFKEIKDVLKYLMDNTKTAIAEKDYKSGRYVFSACSDNRKSFYFELKRDVSKSNSQPTFIDGLDRFSDQELENLLECIIKELIISSNFNCYNKRKELVFFSKTDVFNSITTISAGVKNKANNLLKISYKQEDK
jgi:hypothetical protein